MRRLTKFEQKVNQTVGQYPVASAVGSGVLTGLVTGTLYSTTAWLFARSQGATAGLIWKNALLWGVLAGAVSGVMVAMAPTYHVPEERQERRGSGTSSLQRRRRSSAA